MRIKKSQLKELVRQSIYDTMFEQDDKPAGDGGPKQAKTDLMDNPFDEREKEDMEESAADDVSKAKEKAQKAAEKTQDLEKKAAEKELKKAKEKVKVSEVVKPKRTTVKEVKKWFKTLEENRYKKTYASDARRVSWLVNNNLSEDYEAMPISMKKKWSKAQYGRERYLAKEYVKHLKSKQVNESKVRKLVREAIYNLVEGRKLVQWQIRIKDKLKVDKILKKSGGKIGKNYDIGVGRSGTFVLELDRKFEDKVLELLIKNRIEVKEL